LDRIDQEACIKGILNLHYGKGLFFVEKKTPFSIRIDGDAQNTYSAFHSLRILNALDRVNDLEKWEFRPENSKYKRKDNHTFTSFDFMPVEAWLMQKEFRAFMDNR
jgi:hypothetical protein